MSNYAYPVYKNFFELDSSSDNDFHKIVALFLNWSQKHLGETIPQDIYEGKTGTFKSGQAEVDVVNSGTKNVVFWAGRLSHPDKKLENRQWSVEISFAKLSATQRWKTGISVSYQDDGYKNPTANFGVPTLVRDLRMSVGLILDNQNNFLQAMSLHDIFPVLSPKERGEAFVDYLSLKDRRHPVVLLSKSEQTDRFLLDPNRFYRALFGLAHVITINKQESAILSDIVGKNLSSSDGAVRVYKPGFSIEAKPFDHPIYRPHDIKFRQTKTRDTENYLANDITRDFMLGVRPQDVPSFSLIKSTFLTGALEDLQRQKQASLSPTFNERANRAPEEVIEDYLLHREEADAGQPDTQAHMPPVSSENEGTSKEIEAAPGEEVASPANEETLEAVKILEAVVATQQLKLRETGNQLDEAMGLAIAESDEAKKAKIALAQVVEEREALARQLATFPQSPSLKKGIFPPLDLVGEWCDAVLPDKVWISTRARKSAKGALYRFPDIAYNGILLLGGAYRDMRRAQNDDKRQSYRHQYNQAVQKLALEDRRSIHPEQASIYGLEYYTSLEDSTKMFLDRHLCRGDTFDTKNCLRIYYAWDHDNERVVIGHLPTHLTNSLT